MQTFTHFLMLTCGVGAIPIPGAKSVDHIKDSLGALGWRLDANEVAMIDEKLASLSL
jgi:pyridoxine 4-dehydrogenase